MEDVDQWLQVHRPACGEVSSKLKDAIAEFVLVWSLFEHMVLTPANDRLHREAALVPEGYVKNNYDLIEEAALRGVANIARAPVFQEAFAYHRTRTFDGVNFSEHLDHLIEEGKPSRARIKAIYDGTHTGYRAEIAALLHVAYCLRTNLIHGFKWASGLQNQEDNFRHATQVLMLAIDNPA
ncbi:hypothetical protein [Pseudophaeobacter sp.]|uniref:hypothetical protein n=1 Tax=Pseudophaeobacter sp. TaxID=1971739 RepID=UPI003298D75C